VLIKQPLVNPDNRITIKATILKNKLEMHNSYDFVLCTSSISLNKLLHSYTQIEKKERNQRGAMKALY